MSSNLNNWPIFSLFDSKFVTTIKIALVFGNSGNEAFVVTKDNVVYGIGSNTNGCLGIGNSQSTLLPKKVDVFSDKDPIKTFAYGSGPHVLALTTSGNVFAWGHNAYCELGNGTSNQVLSPAAVKVINEVTVTAIACGSHHSLALTDNGSVYAWGQNNCGQVGSGMGANHGTPKKVGALLATRKVVAITCGQTSSMALTKNGEVYGWGYNGVGQLGIGNFVNQLSPCKVSGLDGIVIEKISCGYAHTLALSDEGILYVWGGNSYGQLGLCNKSNSSTPVKLDEPEMGRVTDIATLHCNHISVAIGENGRVFMWGQCRSQSITKPMATPFTNLYDALAAFAIPSVMHEPLTLYATDAPTILECWKKAFDDPETSDLIIQVQGKPIHVHKSYLKIRCQYFDTMFQNHWTENNQSVLVQDQFSYEVYKAFLKYLYTDEVDLPAENALELLDLANSCFEAQLKSRCVQIIKQGITVKNVAFLYSTAMDYHSEELEDFCFKFALNHMTAVIQSDNFDSLEESKAKIFIRKAARAGAFKT